MFGDSAIEYLHLIPEAKGSFKTVNQAMAIFNMGHSMSGGLKIKNGVEGNEINEIQLSKLQDFDVIEYGFPKLSAKNSPF